MNFIDNQGLRHVTEKIVQGDAIKVASHRGHTVKNVIDNIKRECENVSTPNTMTLENISSEFKVGKGRDVDISGDVEDGNVKVELNGVSWQNILDDATVIIGGSACEVTNVDIDNLSFEVRFLNKVLGNNSNNRAGIRSNIRNFLKPNKTYTFIYKYTLLENPFNDLCCLGIAIDMWGDSYCNTRTIKEVGFSGVVVQTWTTHSNIDNYSGITNFYNVRGRNSKWKVEGLIVLEGDHTDLSKDELFGYFKGIKSSFDDGTINIEVRGKNLLQIKQNQSSGNGITIITDEKTQIIRVNGTCTADTYIYLLGERWKSKLNTKPHNSYSATVIIDGEVDNREAIRPECAYLHLGYKDNNSIKKGYWSVNLNTLGTFKSHLFKTTPYDFNDLWIRIPQGGIYNNFTIKLQIENNAPTQYEAYYEKQISFDIDEPLRSLPNGVCDEIRNNNGQWELVRRVHKQILDGDSTKWRVDNGTNETFNDFRHVLSVDGPIGKNTYNGLCDNFKYIDSINYSGAWIGIKEGICVYNHLHATEIIISTLKTKFTNLDSFKKWLKQNPSSVYFELKTPVITPIKPLEFGFRSLATMNINSKIPPVSKHTVALNRTGQIEQGILKIAELKNRVDELETAYENHIINTQLKLSLLNLDYTLGKEEI